MKNGMALVGYAAVGTGIVFFTMGALAQSIKRDLSFMGKFLFVGMIALLVAMIANMFLQIPALALTIDAVSSWCSRSSCSTTCSASSAAARPTT